MDQASAGGRQRRGADERMGEEPRQAQMPIVLNWSRTARLRHLNGVGSIGVSRDTSWHGKILPSKILLFIVVEPAMEVSSSRRLLSRPA
jgi:hypothetical protein